MNKYDMITKQDLMEMEQDQAYALLLLGGPDWYDGDDYDELLESLDPDRK